MTVYAIDPWSVVGWFLTACIAAFVLVVLAIGLAAFSRGLKEKHRWQKAHKGRLKCEAGSCKLMATHRTPNGFFCEVDRRVNSTRKTLYAEVTWSQPLDYIKKEEA